MDVNFKHLSSGKTLEEKSGRQDEEVATLEEKMATIDLSNELFKAEIMENFQENFEELRERIARQEETIANQEKRILTQDQRILEQDKKIAQIQKPKV